MNDKALTSAILNNGLTSERKKLIVKKINANYRREKKRRRKKKIEHYRNI